MPKGPAGGPRPLASSSLVILATVKSVEAHPYQVENLVNKKTSHNLDVDLDTGVLTFGFQVGSMAISWRDAEELKRKIRQTLNDLGMEVEGFSLGAR